MKFCCECVKTETFRFQIGKCYDNSRKEAKFVYNEYLGFLTFCPTNLGTTIKTTIDIKFKNLNQTQVISMFK